MENHPEPRGLCNSIATGMYVLLHAHAKPVFVSLNRDGVWNFNDRK